MSTQDAGLRRKAQVLAFLLKHRNAGVFGGLARDAAEDDAAPPTGDHDAPARFVEELEALGPAFIKVGQALSTRPDMVPPHYIAALERIQDNVDPLPIEVVRQAVEDELGVRLNAVFSSFDETPLGSASLAQVHRATLRDGRAVAVKVQRPGIRDAIRADLDAIASLAEASDRWTDIGRRMHFSAWADEFRRTLLAELDYRIEAENLERFHAHFSEYPELFVPLPLWDFTKAHVLTMTLVTGVKVTDISGLRRTEQDFGQLASALVRGYLDQVFVHGQIHADPHPGNLLVTEDGRIALLDLGMVAHVPPKRREQMLKLLFASVDGRGEEAAAESISMSTRLEDFDEERYVRDVGQMVARYAAHSGANGQSEGRLVLDLTILGAACGLRTPPELTLLGKTLLNLESACKALDPAMDVKTIVEGHLDHVMRARFRKSFSPANLASEAMEVQALVRESPRKIANLLTLLAENRMQVRVTGLVESQLIENLQKIANRISTGIIVASLVLASAMLMRQDGGTRLFGYPALAFVLFVVAAGLGLGIVVSAMARDRKARPDETRGPG
jgi:predicted unusual protein kinase regulating ubiquinone biosynthesis (AarF/ABC1/UbiB family)